jgi:hypothetical protein
MSWRERIDAIMASTQVTRTEAGRQLYAEKRAGRRSRGMSRRKAARLVRLVEAIVAERDYYMRVEGDNARARVRELDAELADRQKAAEGYANRPTEPTMEDYMGY